MPPLSFPTLIILLLPGFLSLWVYQGFTYEEIHKKGELHYGSLGLLFGMADVMLCFLLNGSSLFELAASPKTIASREFCLQYAILAAVALVLGFVSGVFLRITKRSPVGWLRWCGAKLLNFNERMTVESAADFVLDRLQSSSAALLIEILNEDGSCKSMGMFFGNSYDPAELALTDAERFYDLSEEKSKYLRTLTTTDIILSSGQVVRAVPLTEEQKSYVLDAG